MSYRTRLLEAWTKARAAGMVKGVMHTLIEHDDHCPCVDGYGGDDRCTCNPDIEIISAAEYQRRKQDGQL